MSQLADMSNRQLINIIAYHSKLHRSHHRNNEAVNETLRKAVHGEYSLPGDDGYIYQVDGKTYPILFVYENNIYVGWNDQVKRFISVPLLL